MSCTTSGGSGDGHIFNHQSGQSTVGIPMSHWEIPRYLRVKLGEGRVWEGEDCGA